MSSSTSNSTSTSPSSTVTPAHLPSYTHFSPPPHVATPASSYAQSIASSKSSSSKSLLARIYNKRSSSETFATGQDRQKMAQEKEIRAAARAAYFTMK